MKKTLEQTLVFRCQQQLANDLKQLAKKEGVTVSEVIRRALDEKINKMNKD